MRFCDPKGNTYKEELCKFCARNKRMLGPQWEYLFATVHGGKLLNGTKKADVALVSLLAFCSLKTGEYYNKEQTIMKYKAATVGLTDEQHAIKDPNEKGKIVLELLMENYLIPQKCNIMCMLARDDELSKYTYFELPCVDYRKLGIVWERSKRGFKSINGFLNGKKLFSYMPRGELFGFADIPKDNATFILDKDLLREHKRSTTLADLLTSGENLTARSVLSYLSTRIKNNIENHFYEQFKRDYQLSSLQSAA